MGSPDKGKVRSTLLASLLAWVWRAILVIAEESATQAADSVSVTDAIKCQYERYWPDVMQKLFLPSPDWALARKLLGKPPAARELTAEMLAYTS